ncbi:hypothetical protein [uncultured Winogradskyella sp.]|nr:hypothetical protein [uncultured Winogradskyella sp.]
MKSKRKTVNSDFIIYQLNDPKKAVVFEGLPSKLKSLIEASPR